MYAILFLNLSDFFPKLKVICLQLDINEENIVELISTDCGIGFFLFQWKAILFSMSLSKFAFLPFFFTHEESLDVFGYLILF